MTRDNVLIGAGAAGLQAVGTTILISTGQSFLIGRPWSLQRNCGLSPVLERSHDPMAFDFAFWNRTRDGVYFLTSSSRTATAFAFVSAMAAYYQERAWIRWVGYPFALLIGLSMLEGDGHWASGVVAGALTGQAICWSVGKSMRREYDRWFGRGAAEPASCPVTSCQIVPIVARDRAKLVLQLQL